MTLSAATRNLKFMQRGLARSAPSTPSTPSAPARPSITTPSGSANASSTNGPSSANASTPTPTSSQRERDGGIKGESRFAVLATSTGGDSGGSSSTPSGAIKNERGGESYSVDNKASAAEAGAVAESGTSDERWVLPRRSRPAAASSSLLTPAPGSPHVPLGQGPGRWTFDSSYMAFVAPLPTPTVGRGEGEGSRATVTGRGGGGRMVFGRPVGTDDLGMDSDVEPPEGGEGVEGGEREMERKVGVRAFGRQNQNHRQKPKQKQGAGAGPGAEVGAKRKRGPSDPDPDADLDPSTSTTTAVSASSSTPSSNRRNPLPPSALAARSIPAHAHTQSPTHVGGRIFLRPASRSPPPSSSAYPLSSTQPRAQPLDPRSITTEGATVSPADPSPDQTTLKRSAEGAGRKLSKADQLRQMTRGAVPSTPSISSASASAPTGGSASEAVRTQAHDPSPALLRSKPKKKKQPASHPHPSSPSTVIPLNRPTPATAVLPSDANNEATPLFSSSQIDTLQAQGVREKTEAHKERLRRRKQKRRKSEAVGKQETEEDL